MDAQHSPITEVAKHPMLAARINLVRDWRRGLIPSKDSKDGKDRAAPSTRSLADYPTKFHVNVFPDDAFLVVPENGSSSREYVPAGWMEPPTVPSSLVRISEEAKLWHFAIIISRIHMAWVNHIGGRLKSDPRYSIGLVYNTFPWPDAAPAQRAKIEQLAKTVLDARAAQTTASLALLYDPNFMPPGLRRAHHALDLAVDRLYRPAAFASDRDRVEHLFGRYEALVSPLEHEGVRQNRRVSRRASRKGGAEVAA